MRWPDDNEDDFDGEEYPDDPDESEVIPCPNCRAEIHEDSVRCPICGDYITATNGVWTNKPAWFKRIAWLLLGLAFLGFVLFELRIWVWLDAAPPISPPGTLRVRE